MSNDTPLEVKMVSQQLAAELDAETSQQETVFGFTMEEAARAAAATLRREQAAPVAVPDGWKPVPIRPTIEMVEAGYEAALGEPDRSGSARVIDQYEAMLAAAPTPPAQQPVAWQDPDNPDRLCSSRCMDDAKRVGGATLSAVRPLTRPLYAAAPAQQSQQQELSSIEAVVRMLEDGEWAEHVGMLGGPISRRLEEQITRLHIELDERIDASGDTAAPEPCPVCQGDCSAANPPVASCPIRKGGDA